MSLWISSHDMAELLDEEALIEGIRSGFRAWTDTLPVPHRFHSTLVDIPQTTDQAGIRILAPGALLSLPAFTVKVPAKYPNNPRQPMCWRGAMPIRWRLSGPGLKGRGNLRI